MGSVSRRLQLITLGGIGVAALVAVVLLSSDSSGGISLFPGQRGSASADPTATPAPGAFQSDLEPDEDVDETYTTIADFVAAHGEPPNSDFARLRIPAIGVDAPVGLFIVDEGMMPEPQGPVDVAFYDMRHWEGMGGYPGGGGNAIFGGHVDLNRRIHHADDAHFRGPAVFWHLDSLTPGDVIEVDYNGATLRYAVTWVEHLAAEGTSWRPIWSDNVATDSITLFTCGGVFDPDTRSYPDRIVVRAERV